MAFFLPFCIIFLKNTLGAGVEFDLITFSIIIIHFFFEGTFTVAHNYVTLKINFLFVLWAQYLNNIIL